MKKLLLFNLLMLIGDLCIGQKKDSLKPQIDSSQTKAYTLVIPTGYLAAFSFGSSIPVNSYSNWANPGINYSLSCQIPVIKHSQFGIAFMLGNQTNSFKSQAYINGAKSSSLYFVSAAAANNLESNELLLGCYATIPVHRFSFDFRMMIGGASSEYSAISAIDSTGNIYNGGTLDMWTFTVDFGAGVRYNLSKSFTLMLNWNYINSSNFTYIDHVEANNYLIQRTLSETMKISSFNTSFGIGLIL